MVGECQWNISTGLCGTGGLLIYEREYVCISKSYRVSTYIIGAWIKANVK